MIGNPWFKAECMQVTPEERALIEFVRSQSYGREMEAQIRAFEATNQSPKGTEGGDTGTRGNK